MKKFLTMLLALSVVFTYTFGAAGSVFAATTYTQAEYLANLAEAEAQVLETQAAEYALAKATVKHDGDKKYDTGSYKIGGEYWLAQLDVLYADTVKAIKEETAALQTAVKYESYKTKEVSELVELYVKDKTSTALGEALYAADGDYAFAAAKAQFNEDKATAIANAKSVDTSIYSTTEDKTKEYQIVPYGESTPSKYYVAKDFADAVIAKVVATAEAVVLGTSDTKAADVAAQASKLATNLVVKNATTKKYEIAEATVAQNPYDGSIYILSKDEEAAMKAQNDANAASKKATIASNVATAYSKAVGSLTADELTAWNTVKAAYEEVETYLAENGLTASVNTFPVKDTDYTITKNVTTGVYEAADKEDNGANYLDIVKRVADLKTLAASLKVAKDLDGNKAYDDALVDETLEKLVEAAYKSVKTASWVYVAPAASEFSAAELKYVSTFEKETTKAELAAKVKADDMKLNFLAVKDATTLGAGSEVFYALEWASVENAIAAYNVAVDAAVTKADLKEAMKTLNTSIAALKNVTDVNGLYTAETSKTMGEAAVNLFDLAEKTVALADSGKASGAKIKNQYIAKYASLHDDSDANAAVTKYDIKVWCAEQGARTLAEVTALNDKLTAEIKALQTADEKKAADDAAVANVKALVAALPTALNATLADADAAIAADKAYKALDSSLLAQVTAENTKLTALLDNLRTIYSKAITDKLAEVNKDGQVTIDEKAIVDETVNLNEKYVELRGSTVSGVTTAKTKLRAAELANVKKLIKDLPTDITKEDKAAVEAARTAYDAFVAEYTTYDDKNVCKDVYNAATYVDNSAKLLMAEATLASLTKYTNTDAKADLLDMARKVTIWRTSKTSIRVTAVGSVANITDNGYTVKYTFYKKAPGAKAYKAIKTTTSNKYTYTNLKKGTNKFQVKVKVYDAEGKLVASKMTYYRAAKVK